MYTRKEWKVKDVRDVQKEKEQNEEKDACLSRAARWCGEGRCTPPGHEEHIAQRGQYLPPAFGDRSTICAGQVVVRYKNGAGQPELAIPPARRARAWAKAECAPGAAR